MSNLYQKQRTLDNIQISFSDYKRTRISLLIIIIAITFPLFTSAQHSDNTYSIRDANQVLFLGNSITYDGRYVAMVESVMLHVNSTNKTNIINLGLPSETVSGLSEEGHAGGQFPRPCLFDRLGNMLETLQSDVALVCYGMNDGIFKPFDEERFKAYKLGMNRLYSELLSAGVKRIIVMTPPIHDDALVGLNGYNKVLDKYSEWILEQRDAQGWEVIDLHFPMKHHLECARSEDESYKLANDGVHPGDEGHWLMAREILLHLYPEYPKYNSWEEYLESEPYVKQLYDLVYKSQDITKKAWLTKIGHKRPGIPVGLPIDEANVEVDKIRKKILELY